LSARFSLDPEFDWRHLLDGAGTMTIIPTLA
jgi:hypothetical protein